MHVNKGKSKSRHFRKFFNLKSIWNFSPLRLFQHLINKIRGSIVYIQNYLTLRKPNSEFDNQPEVSNSICILPKTASEDDESNDSNDLTDDQLEDLFSLETTVEELFTELKCPICNEFLSKDIKQCLLGHSFCSVCISKLNNKCPLCKSRFESTRNYSLENLTEHIKLPCVNWTFGCRETISLANWKVHLEDCDHGVFHCPMRDENLCTWKGRLCELKRHLSFKHNITIDTINAITNSIENKQRFYYYISILNYNNKYFKLFEIHTINNTGHVIKWVMQYIGSKSFANNYMFTLDFEDQKNVGYKLTASSYCVPYEQLIHQKPLYSFSVNENNLENFKSLPIGYKYSVTIKHVNDPDCIEKTFTM